MNSLTSVHNEMGDLVENMNNPKCSHEDIIGRLEEWRKDIKEIIEELEEIKDITGEWQRLR